MRNWYWILLVVVFGCGPRLDVSQTRAPSAHYTIADYNRQLAGKTRDEVKAALGPPSVTSPTQWTYDRGAWDPYAEKYIPMYIQFGGNGRVIRCVD